MPKISIIVPVYNVENYLRKCLDSLVMQTIQDIEILVINDGSPDNSQAIIDEYAAKDSRIRAFTKENGGIATVRNYGLAKATGEYIGFVDSDDYVEKDMFEKLYELAKETDCDVACCNYFLTFEDHEEPREEYPYQGTKEMLTRFFGILWNKIYKKSFLDSLDFSFPDHRRYEDSFYLTHMAYHAPKMAWRKEPLIHYVQRSNSMTNTHNKMTLDAVYMLEHLKNYFYEKGAFDTYRDEIEYVYIRFCLGNPFVSTSKIKDQAERKEALELLWSTLNTTFPAWRKNHYLKDLPGAKHRYFRILNKPLYDLSAWIFSKR